MKTIWDRLHVWLAANAPQVLESLRPGASEKAIRAAERKLGVKFPDDVKACYRIHDGQRENDPPDFLYGRWWSSLSWMVGVASRTGRLPIAAGGMGDCFFLDLTPDEDGETGRIRLWWSDLAGEEGYQGVVVARSLTQWLADFVHELEQDEWIMHPDWSGLVHIDDVDIDEEFEDENE